MSAATFVGRSMRFRAFAKANACGAISSPRAFNSTNIAQEAATRNSNGKIDVAELLSKPSWSVASLLPSKSETSSAPEISSNQLHHLLRLSALPPPKSPEEEQSMLSTLSSQLHFVKDIQAVDTTGVEPLRSLRDETAQGEAQAELGVEALKEALEKESVRGKYHKRIRRNKDVAEKKTRDWDPLATAHKKVGRFFVVEGEKSDKAAPSSSKPAVILDLFLATRGERLRRLQLSSNTTATIVMEQQAIYNDAVAPLPTPFHSEHDFANTAASKERLHAVDHTQPGHSKKKGTCVEGSSAAGTRVSQKRTLDHDTTSTVAKRPRTDETPAAEVHKHGHCRDNPPKSSARQTSIDYDEHEHGSVPPSEGVTCFFCPAKTNQSKEKSASTKAKKGRPVKRRVEYSLYSKRVDEQEERDVDAEDDDDRDDVSEAPSCGQELFTGEDWYLKGFE
ncbi:hypothetical protein D0867_12223 [Hortaea werneckii]|uniref:Glutamyl-tRNA amidotransferase complex subunit Gta3 domain-containing protein n=1 Tax=Hortaea werneckii TaxID=91943 RepID=A0A3M6XNR9_HORWE|nr:hypothetical protein D0868_13430 [Hortaea werneckii]RMX99085.1 hypothetical protein D0867_12223 [Hortaea werneckii]RMY20061.1 hypothetical protein D0866_12634 [Hortaea werneckii]